MRRTTVSIDSPLFQSIKEICHREGKKLTAVIGELLQLGLTAKRQKHVGKMDFKWHSQKMEPLIATEDKDTLYKILDGLK